MARIVGDIQQPNSLERTYKGPIDRTSVVALLADLTDPVQMPLSIRSAAVPVWCEETKKQYRWNETTLVWEDTGVHSGADITTGTIDDARLSANVALRNQPNTFTKPQTMQSDTITGVATTSQNINANGTGDLHQYKLGTTQVGKVTASGVADFAGFREAGNKEFVNMGYVDKSMVVGLSDIPSTEITKLVTAANWSTTNAYVGPTIINTYQGQEYFDTATRNRYECMADNVWIRFLAAPSATFGSYEPAFPDNSNTGVTYFSGATPGTAFFAGLVSNGAVVLKSALDRIVDTIKKITPSTLYFAPANWSFFKFTTASSTIDVKSSIDTIVAAIDDHTSLYNYVDVYGVPAAAIAQLINNSNWDNSQPQSNYIGTPIVGTYQGQEYFDSATDQHYHCVADNVWVKNNPSNGLASHSTIDVSANTSVLSTHNAQTLLIKATSTVTLPTGMPSGFQVRLFVVTGTLTVAAGAGVTILPNNVLSFQQYESCLLIKDGATETYYISY